MADAQEIVAPLPKGKKEKEPTPEELIMAQKFDPKKKYMFELAAENLERELPVLSVLGGKTTKEPHVKFKPYNNIVFTSQIVWNGERRIIRYYDGCTSLFIDDQPKEPDTIKQLIKQTRRRVFLEGKFGCFGDERMLLLYLMICSWNVESEFRTRTASEVFRASNPDRMATEESNRMDAIEKALALAREATILKMKVHAAYLGIPEMDYDSGNLLTEKEIRTLYRKSAANDPIKFIESYGNKSIEIKYFIDKALRDGTISNKGNANKAVWKGSGTVICDISGLKSHAAISERLFEFSQEEDGEEFEIQLKALYSN
jgi:hypothetical protein